MRISYDRGVCGAAATSGEIQLINDVELVPHHIACSSSTRSEIVLPVHDRLGNLRSLLDIDSDKKGNFDVIDEKYLRKICLNLSNTCYAF